MCAEGSSSSREIGNARGSRIQQHPILGRDERTPCCTIWVDGQPIPACQGEPILAAMLAAGVVVTRRTEKHASPRGLFCGIGLCTDCMVTVNGVPNQRSCIIQVQDGMRIETCEEEADDA